MLWIILLVVFAAALVLLAVLCARVLGGMRQPSADAKTVVVLGCEVRGETPSPLLDHRIDSAADYLRQHPDAVCIASGGQGDGERITEAECIRIGLISRGIDAARIWKEDASATTRENLEFSKRLMEAEKLPAPALIVTSNFHVCRALQTAKALGLRASGLPAACERRKLPFHVLREALALVKFHLS